MSDNTSALMAVAMDQLRREGVPEQNLRAAAAHLVGQAQMESGLNPNLTHDGGTGYGIYGAGHERRDNMLSWLSQNGYPQNSAEGQMRYMAREAMTNAYGPTRSALLNATPDTLARDARTITANFERPAVNNDRSGATLAAYNAYDPNSPATIAASPPGAQPPATATTPAQTPAGQQQPPTGLLAGLGISNPFNGTGGALMQPASVTTPFGDIQIGGGQQGQQGGNDALKALNDLKPDQQPQFGSLAPMRRPDMSSFAALNQPIKLGLLS